MPERSDPRVKSIKLGNLDSSSTIIPLEEGDESKEDNNMSTQTDLTSFFQKKWEKRISGLLEQTKYDYTSSIR